VRLVGRSESQFDEMLQPLYRDWCTRQPPVAATILASSGVIELQLGVRVRGDDGEAALERAAHDVCELFGLDVISDRGEGLEAVIGQLLRARGWRIALAESCTGGLACSRLTDIAGASEYVERGVVAYSNRAKIEMLGVPEPLIAEHGAVSEPVAAGMAQGVRRAAGVEIGVGITGIAGPGGGSEAKPVGTVAIAVAGPGDRVRVRTHLFAGSREMIKTFASTTALDRVRRALLRG
jgi:nicotinamide-nucleotide amidase